MRRKLSKINDLHRTHRAPPNDERRTTNDGRRTKKPENARFEGRTPLFRASIAPASDPQPQCNEPLTPVSAQRAFFGPLAPLMRREPPLPLPQPTTYIPNSLC